MAEGWREVDRLVVVDGSAGRRGHRNMDWTVERRNPGLEDGHWEARSPDLEDGRSGGRSLGSEAGQVGVRSLDSEVDHLEVRSLVRSLVVVDDHRVVHSPDLAGDGRHRVHNLDYHRTT